MEFRKLFFIAVLIFISMAGAAGFYAFQSNRSITSSKKTTVLPVKPGDYARDWEKVNSFADDASENAEEIRTKAEDAVKPADENAD